jgi:hypothetical protein
MKNCLLIKIHSNHMNERLFVVHEIVTLAV